MRAEIQQDVLGVHVPKQAAGIIILRQHAMVKQDPTIKLADGILSGIIVMKQVAGKTQTEQVARHQDADGKTITAAKYGATILIIQIRQHVRTTLLIFHVHGALLIAIQQAVGTIIANLHVKHKQNVHGKLLQAVGGAKNLAAGRGIR